MLSHRSWLKVKGISVADSLNHFHLVRHVFVERPFPSASLLSLHRLPVLCHDPQRHLPRWKGTDKTPRASADWSGMSGCMANPTQNLVLITLCVLVVSVLKFFPTRR